MNKKGIYTICTVGIDITSQKVANPIHMAVGALVEDISTAVYKDHIVEYIGSPCFVTDGNKIVAMQAILIDPEFKFPEQELPKAPVLSIVDPAKPA